MQTLDDLYTMRKQAYAEIDRIDREFIEWPDSPMLAEARKDWARAAYLADSELERRARVYAYESEQGIQATCTTTGECYIALSVQFTRINNRRAVWCTCRHCDNQRRTRLDREFDPSSPQRHLYYLDEVRYADR